MPSYTYFCKKCDKSFEHFFSISKYKEKIKCQSCKSYCKRFYEEDMLTINGSVRKSDSELKTIGDLANRNRDKMSSDEIQSLNDKHNAYKEQESIKQLPKGMSRIKKPKHKMKWR